MGCKHQWKLIDKTILPSAAEQMAENESTRLKSVSGPPDHTAMLFRKKVIVILTCNLCGKLDKTTESNP